MSLHAFGYLCYAHLYFNHKPDPQSTPFIFLGYPSHHRGYRCLDLNTIKIILSRYVTFKETVFPYGSMTPNSSPSYTFLDTSPNLIQQHLLTHPTPTNQLTPPSPVPPLTHLLLHHPPAAQHHKPNPLLLQAPNTLHQTQPLLNQLIRFNHHKT